MAFAQSPIWQLLQAILADANVTGAWIFLSSVFEELSTLLSEALGIPLLTAALTVLCTGLAVYEPVCTAIGGSGASFSPAVNFALAGAGKGSLGGHALRSVGQAVGGALGAAAAVRLIPQEWQSKFGNYAHGVMPGVSIVDGFLAEAVLSFLLNLAILWGMETRYKSAGKLAPYIATVILIPLGTGLSGPFMNPAVAFSWFYNLKGTSAWEHFLVFWVGCLLGSYAAGLTWSTIKYMLQDQELSAAPPAPNRVIEKSVRALKQSTNAAAPTPKEAKKSI